MQWMPYFMAIAAGLLNPVQAACNGTLNRVLGRPFLVMMVSISVSLTCALIVGVSVGGLSVPSGRAASAPWWAWCGGAIGAVLVLSQPLAALKLGASTFIGLTVTASLVASVIMDHYGIMGFSGHAVSVPRLAGCVLMIVGVALITRF